jgi:hypothetical protein
MMRLLIATCVIQHYADGRYLFQARHHRPAGELPPALRGTPYKTMHELQA